MLIIQKFPARVSLQGLMVGAVTFGGIVLHGGLGGSLLVILLRGIGHHKVGVDVLLVVVRFRLGVFGGDV